jgi:hypothetical protein
MKGSKYHNKKVVIDGILFDSTREGNYYKQLKGMEDEGRISNLRLQVPYVIADPVWVEVEKPLKTKTKIVKYCVWKGLKYIADFVYTDNSTGEEVVVDVKGTRTNTYKHKKLLMKRIKGIEITEV